MPAGAPVARRGRDARRNEGTGQVATATTDADGTYMLAGLAPRQLHHPHDRRRRRGRATSVTAAIGAERDARPCARRRRAATGGGAGAAAASGDDRRHRPAPGRNARPAKSRPTSARSRSARCRRPTATSSASPSSRRASRYNDSETDKEVQLGRLDRGRGQRLHRRRQPEEPDSRQAASPASRIQPRQPVRPARGAGIPRPDAELQGRI